MAGKGKQGCGTLMVIAGVFAVFWASQEPSTLANIVAGVLFLGGFVVFLAGRFDD
jgi:hypothetical protein